MTVAQIYAYNVDTPSDINEHLPTFVQLCRDTRAQKVIELGVRDGVSTVGWLYGLEQTGGHLWSVDVSGKPAFDSDNWTFIQGSDIDPGVFGQLPSDADIVFIDTSHEYQHTVDEIAIYSQRVRPGGHMVFHDSAVAEFGVKQAIDEWVARDDLDVVFHENNNGLAVVWLPCI